MRESGPEWNKNEVVRNIVKAYDDPVVRIYSTIRFGIFRQRFLDEIGQYLPSSGLVVDIGCGFGLFSLYYATLLPDIKILGLDLNARRIELARNAARTLQLSNVEYEVCDAREISIAQEIQAAYMLDVIHHISEESVEHLIESIANAMAPGSTLIIKDIETFPRFKLAFTWLLDKLMDPLAPLHYWTPAEVLSLLESRDFRAYKHSMLDYLPYPHIIYIARKNGRGSAVRHRTARPSSAGTLSRSAS